MGVRLRARLRMEGVDSQVYELEQWYRHDYERKATRKTMHPNR